MYVVMFDGCVSDFEFGGILLFMCIKGELVEEIVGFLVVVEVFFMFLYVLVGFYVLVVLFSYNGLCKMVNLMLLLCLLLVWCGVFVLMYGVIYDLQCVISVEIFIVLGVLYVVFVVEVEVCMVGGLLVFILIVVLVLVVLCLFDLCCIFGVCNFMYMLVKIM